MRWSAKASMLVPPALLLAGCAATTLPEFEAAQTDRDRLADVSMVGENIDAESTRFIGEVEGADLYLAREGEDTLCLIHVRDDKWEQTWCGAHLGLGTELRTGTLIEAGTFAFPADQVADGVREKISESVTVITFP